MKKILTIISKVVLALAVIAFALSMIIPGITKDALDASYMVLVFANVSMIICATVGSILTAANSDTARRVGHGMIIAAFVAGLSIALMLVDKAADGATLSPFAAVTDDEEKTVSSTSAIIMIVAAALLAVYYIFQFVVLILNKASKEAGSPYEDSKIIRVKEWKQLLDEGIITKEEYEEKRVAILGIKQKADKHE